MAEYAGVLPSNTTYSQPATTPSHFQTFLLKRLCIYVQTANNNSFMQNNFAIVYTVLLYVCLLNIVPKKMFIEYLSSRLILGYTSEWLAGWKSKLPVKILTKAVVIHQELAHHWKVARNWNLPGGRSNQMQVEPCCPRVILPLPVQLKARVCVSELYRDIRFILFDR